MSYAKVTVFEENDLGFLETREVLGRWTRDGRVEELVRVDTGEVLETRRIGCPRPAPEPSDREAVYDQG